MVTHLGQSCSADFTFTTVPGGGGWGEPDGGNDVGGQGGCGSTECANAGAGGEGVTAGAGGEGMTTAAGGETTATGGAGSGSNAGGNAEVTAGVAGAAAGGVPSSNGAGQTATDDPGDAGASGAGAPGHAPATDKTGCDCAVPARNSDGMQAWLLLGVSVACAARRRDRRPKKL